MVEDTVQVLINHIYGLMADKEKLNAEIRKLKVDASITTEQAEKARKWDEVKEWCHDGIRYPKDMLEKLMDKANKWDEHKCPPTWWDEYDTIAEEAEKLQKIRQILDN